MPSLTRLGCRNARLESPHFRLPLLLIDAIHQIYDKSDVGLGALPVEIEISINMYPNPFVALEVIIMIYDLVHNYVYVYFVIEVILFREINWVCET